MTGRPRRTRALAAGMAGLIGTGALAIVPTAAPAQPAPPDRHFSRISTFSPTDNDGSLVAEIVTASDDGRTLAYSDSFGGLVGFVDLTDPAHPTAAGSVPLGGEPTSVDIVGSHVLVAVNTSESFVDPSGKLAVVDLATHAVEREIDLGGQPDSIAVSPDGTYAAIAIENERDEDVDDGDIPQLPAGELIIVSLAGAPAAWTTTHVDLTGVADVAPSDPEPEFVDINDDNEVVVTLQENNHLVIVDLATATITGDFSAGTTSVDQIDTVEDGLIELTGSITDVPREPDAVTWLPDGRLATADEGDWRGGSRTFTIFDRDGTVSYDSGNTMEHLATARGHAQEGRADAKGVEPEGIELGTYGDDSILFVGAERSGFVAAFDLAPGADPVLRDFLPTGHHPEGLLALPERDLFVTSNEGDDTVSTITVFALRDGASDYPNLVGVDRPDGTVTPFSALGALTADPDDPSTVYTANDNALATSTIWAIDTRTGALREHAALRDGEGDPVGYDIEGLAARPDGGFWVASEGAGNAPAATSANLLVEVAADGTVQREVPLPAGVDAMQISNGYEGVAVVGRGTGEQVWVAFQRAWTGDPAGFVRIGRYTPATDRWGFLLYPLDEVTSPAGGWVGLSEITSIDGGTHFSVIERDNQAGQDARIKHISTFDTMGLTPVADGEGEIPVVTKVRSIDVLPQLQSFGGYVLEKLEGLTVTADGAVWALTDNDGTDGHNGETRFWQAGTVADLLPLDVSDVGIDHTFRGPIAWLAGSGITEGYGDGTFRPAAPVTRQTMAAFLARLAQLRGVDTTGAPDPGFTDVPTDHLFHDEIAWLTAAGITEGYGDGTFGPAAPVTRQAMAAFLARLAQLEGVDTTGAPDPGFTDVPTDHLFHDQVAWLTAVGITEGYGDGTFGSTAAVSRQALAAFLQRSWLTLG